MKRYPQTGIKTTFDMIVNIYTVVVVFSFSVRVVHTGLTWMAGRGSVSEQGHVGWENSPDHRSQLWHWEGGGPGYGQAR